MSAEMDVIRSSASHRQAAGFGGIGRRLGASGPHQPCKGANSRAPLQHRLFDTERSGGTVSTSNAALEHIPQDDILPSEASSSQPATALCKLLPGVFQLSSITRQLLSSLRSRRLLRSDRRGLLLSGLLIPLLPGSGWGELGHNYVFVAGFWGWFIAQCLKIFTKRYYNGVWDIRAIVESGGMPSSHSALCTAVTTAVALEFGLGSSLFAVALCFTVITMYDAAGVRWHAGKQAEVLNVLLQDMTEGHPLSEQRLKEVLGHTPLQVAAGALLGIIVGCFVPSPATMPVV